MVEFLLCAKPARAQVSNRCFPFGRAKPARAKSQTGASFTEGETSQGKASNRCFPSGGRNQPERNPKQVLPSRRAKPARVKSPTGDRIRGAKPARAPQQVGRETRQTRTRFAAFTPRNQPRRPNRWKSISAYFNAVFISRNQPGNPGIPWPSFPASKAGQTRQVFALRQHFV